MPLSEHEQRILRQIERQFDQPRGLARGIGVPSDARQAVRNARWAVAWFLLGLVALSLSFVFSWVVGLVGFLVMLAAALTLVRSLRWLGRERWGAVVVEQGLGRARWSPRHDHDPDSGEGDRP